MTFWLLTPWLLLYNTSCDVAGMTYIGLCPFASSRSTVEALEACYQRCSFGA